MKVGYVKSIKDIGDQNVDTQVNALVSDGVKKENIFSDILLGVNKYCPSFEDCMQTLQEGDMLAVYSIDRLGCSQLELIKILSELESKGVQFKVLAGLGAGVDTRTEIGKFLYQLVVIFSEYDRMTHMERLRCNELTRHLSQKVCERIKRHQKLPK